MRTASSTWARRGRCAAGKSGRFAGARREREVVPSPSGAQPFERGAGRPSPWRAQAKPSTTSGEGRRSAARRASTARLGQQDHLMETAHLPTSAKDGFRTHGLIAERGHAEAVKQMAPSLLVSEITAGTMRSSTRTAPKIAATGAPRGFAFVMETFYPRHESHNAGHLGRSGATRVEDGEAWIAREAWRRRRSSLIWNDASSRCRGYERLLAAPRV